MKKVLHFLIVLLLISLFVIPAVYYGQLPEEIPSHYNGFGEVDAYSEKSMIWFMPIVGLVLSALVWVVISKLPQHNPHKVPKQIPELFKELLILFILLPFNYISYATIQVSLGYQEGLGIWFLPVFLGIMFIGVSLLIWKQMGKDAR